VEQTARPNASEGDFSPYDPALYLQEFSQPFVNLNSYSHPSAIKHAEGRQKAEDQWGEDMNDHSLSRSAQTAALAGAAVASAMIAYQSRRDRFSFNGRTVVITGGSRGLGLVLARQLAQQGAQIALIARDPRPLERARQELAAITKVAAFSCDIRKHDQVAALIDAITQRFGMIDVLINNAGIIQSGPLEHMTLQDFEDTMAVHFWGPLYMMHAALPVMTRPGGRIVNISSIGGKIAVPHLAPYSASKFALVGLSDALRHEVAKDGIFVTTVCPGLMRTGSVYNALFKGQHEREFAWFTLSDATPLSSIAASRAARQIIEACRRGRAQLIITRQARAATLVAALAPEFTSRLLSFVTRMLPGPNGDAGYQARFGWESQPRWLPSAVTLLVDRAARTNNELPAVRAS
jgi:NAD(P)-dependent dehydrogenase (short-subunit alcohol dehydrogenase family)